MFQEIYGSDPIYITKNEYTPNQWTNLTFQFNVPDVNGLNWFAIEVESTSNGGTFHEYCDSYLCIDDVSVLPGCINGCSSTASTKGVCGNNIINDEVPFILRGLRNLTNVKLSIISVLGQTYEVLNINNPPSIIAWDGKLPNGPPISNGRYFYEVEATNDCGTDIFYGDGYELVKSMDYEGNSPYLNHEPVSKPPIPGCLKDIYITNQTLFQDKTYEGPLLYAAKETIAASNVIIPANSEIEFDAGKNITASNLTISGNSNIKFEAGDRILLSDMCINSGTVFYGNILGSKNKLKTDSIYYKTISFTKLDSNSNKFNIIDSNQNNNIIDPYGGLSENINIKSNISENISDKIISYKITPNPFTQSTKISYNINGPGKVRIAILNSMNVKVEELVNEFQTEGNHQVVLDGSNLCGGIYYCILEIDNNRKVEKIVLVK